MKEFLQKALDALGPVPPECCGCQTEWQIAIDAIKSVLAEQENVRDDLRESMSEEYMTEFLFLKEEEYDQAIIGVAERAGMDSVIAYSTGKIIDILCRSMPYDDAVDHFDFNIAGAYMGEKTPIFISLILPRRPGQT